MILIENKKHTIKYSERPHKSLMSYEVLEYCEIIEEKEVVKHPDFKKDILKKYNLDYEC